MTMLNDGIIDLREVSDLLSSWRTRPREDQSLNGWAGGYEIGDANATDDY